MNDSKVKTLWIKTRIPRIVMAVILAVWLSMAWGVGQSEAHAAPAPASVAASNCRMTIGGAWTCYDRYAAAGAAQPTQNWATAGKCAGVAAIGAVGGPIGVTGAGASCLWLSLWP